MNKRHASLPCRPHPLALALACALAGPAFAQQNLPGGFNGVSGVNAPTTVGNTMTVTQTAQRGIAEWQNFSIGSGYSVRFNQPGSSSVLLNRVVGNDRSTIAGSLIANGHIYLINPNGVLFSQGSSVNVGGLIASTLDISNNDFLKGGALKFSRLDGNDASVINEGSITAASGGTIGLMAARVTNSGTLSAPGGTVGLISARTVTVDFDGDGLTTFTIPDDSLASAAWVENSGQVDADGGRIALLAASTVREQVVKQSGTLRARSLSTRGGEIVLGGDTASGNEMLVGGELDVSGTAAGVVGGTVSMDASTVWVEGARIDASGAGQGGSIALRAQGASGDGVIAVDADTSLHADATSANGNGGRIDLLADDRLSVHGLLTARAGAAGGDGGFIETSAAKVDLRDIQVNASAPAGKAGTWLIDPVDIAIAAGGSSPTGYDSVVYDTTISSTLSLGNNVTISTAGPGSSEGYIHFLEGVDIVKSGGGDATFTLFANNSITTSSATGPSIQSSAGELNVVFDAWGGGVSFNGSYIYTNGGYVQIDATSSIRFDNNDIYTNGGYVYFHARGINAMSLESCSVSQSNIITNGGNVTFLSPRLMLGITGSTIDTTISGLTDGSITLAGVYSSGGMAGVVINGTSISGGSIDIAGRSYEYGVYIGTGSTITGSGDVILRASTSNTNHTALLINGQVSAGGVLTLRPGEVDTSGNAVDRPNDKILFNGIGSPNTNMFMSTTAFANLTAPTIVVGGSTHNGEIYAFNGRIETSSALTLLSAGGIHSEWGITADSLVAYSSGGNVNFGGITTHGKVQITAELNVFLDIEITTNGGDVEIITNGYASFSNGHGLGHYINTNGGNLQVTAEGAYFGAYGDIITGGGHVDIFARGSSDGYLFVDQKNIVTNGGAVTLRSPGGSVSITDSTIQTTNGSITLAGGASHGGVGVGIDNTSISGGRIDVAGSSTSSSGVSIGIGSTINSNNDVILRASTSASATDALVINGNVSANGVLNLRPGGVNASGNAVDRINDVIWLGASDPGFSLSAAELARLSASTIVVGSSTHNGNITVNNSITTPSALTLQNGSGGITLNAPVTSPRLGLVSAGHITQNSGVITANNLYARSSGGNVDLQNGATGNSVGTLSGGAGTGSSFDFANASALTVGPVSVTGYNAASNSSQLISAPTNTLTANTVRVQTRAGDLTLGMPVSSTSGANLVAAGVFRNPGNYSISGPWRVWANTWAGEDRGGLVGTANNLPNLYGCTYGDPTCASGVAIPTTGNHFIYVQQPTITVAINDLTREAGENNPTLAYSIVSGTLLPGDEITANLTTTATASSPEGDYPIYGTFASAAGHIINSPAPGKLVVTPPPPPLPCSVTNTCPTTSTTTEPPDDLPSINCAAHGTCDGAIDVINTELVIETESVTEEKEKVETAEVTEETEATEENEGSDHVSGFVPICMKADDIDGTVNVVKDADVLAHEWARISARPRSSNCLGVDQRRGCADF